MSLGCESQRKSQVLNSLRRAHEIYYTASEMYKKPRCCISESSHEQHSQLTKSVTQKILLMISVVFEFAERLTALLYVIFDQISFYYTLAMTARLHIQSFFLLAQVSLDSLSIMLIGKEFYLHFTLQIFAISRELYFLECTCCSLQPLM